MIYVLMYRYSVILYSLIISSSHFRVFVATWNVGGKIPHDDLNLEDFLQAEGSSDIYVLGYVLFFHSPFEIVYKLQV